MGVPRNITLAIRLPNRNQAAIEVAVPPAASAPPSTSVRVMVERARFDPVGRGRNVTIPPAVVEVTGTVGRTRVPEGGVTSGEQEVFITFALPYQQGAASARGDAHRVRFNISFGFMKQLHLHHG